MRTKHAHSTSATRGMLALGMLAFLSQCGDSTAAPQKIDPQVLQSAAAGKTEFLVLCGEQADVHGAAALKTKLEKGTYVYTHLTAAARTAQKATLESLQARGLEHQPFWIANMIWVKGDLAAVQSLGSRGDVSRILPSPRLHFSRPLQPVPAPATLAQAASAVEWNILKVRANQVWALGYTGQGIVVAGQDTGYEWSHPALLKQYRGWSNGAVDHNYNWHDAIHERNSHNSASNPIGYNLTAPADDGMHGTHTMGTMVGDDEIGNRIGMAPGAKWIGCRNMDQGWGTPATYAECFQWFIAPTDLAGKNPDPSKAPDVINNSWGCPPEEGCVDPLILQTIVRNVRAAGIVVVASAGNNGPSCATVLDPAPIYDESFSVGATDSNDAIADFSSRGPAIFAGNTLLKPNISAPGVSVRSCVPGGSYDFGSGTSMAGPHVAGLVALLLSAHPQLRGQVDAIERIIEQTAVPKTSTQSCNGISGSQIPNAVFGWGRIDALDALALNDTDKDGIPDWWELWHNLSRFDPADAESDPDGDGAKNLEEYIAGTDPNDSGSNFHIESVTAIPYCTVKIQSSADRRYTLYSREAAEGSWTAVAGQVDVPGTGGLLSLSDTSQPSTRFYRVKVKLP